MNMNPTMDSNGYPLLDPDELRAEFTELVMKNIRRDGIEELMEWLDTTDFYHAPCSTIYHLACTSGLVAHSINVFRELEKLALEYNYLLYRDKEKLAIVALFHDLCKVNTYVPSRRSKKTGEYNERGKPIWVDYDAYDFAEELPMGHGEKSVYLLTKYLRLSDDEALAIRWHMGAYDNAAKSDLRSLSNAEAKSPLVTLLHVADMLSTMQGW